MFIIWGWGRKTVKDYGPTLPMKCFNCNNDTFSRLIRIKVWFTLFFVPIIPYETKYYLVCDICSRGNELNGQDLEDAKKLNEKTLLYINKEITEEEYQALLKNPNVLSESINPNDNWECPNCGKNNANSDFKCQSCNYRIA